MAPLTRSARKRLIQDDDDGECDKSLVEHTAAFQKTSLFKNSNDDSPNDDPIISCDLIAYQGFRGLINLGASCYINSVMQALLHTPHLRSYLLSDNHKCHDERARICQMCGLLKIFQEYNSGNFMPPMALHRLLYLLWFEAPCLAGPEQQDANEFYMTYIQLLHNSCLRSNSEWLYKFNSTSNSTPCNCIIDQIYAGILESNLTCIKCKNTSSKREIFYDISLELNADEIEDLHNCLRNYTKLEHLDKSCQIFCPNCASNQEFVKKLSLVVLPSVLNINFKRFTQKGSQQKKLTKHVKFPFDLDAKSFANEYSNGTKNEIYSLFAVISHAGTINSGHYTAFVKQTHDMWLLCDDHKIKAVTPEIVSKTEAYILVYHRRNVEALNE